MPEDKALKYKEQGYELSPSRVVYADAECMIDSESQAHLPATIGMYDVWHVERAMSDCGQYRIWDGQFKFLSEIERMAKEQFEHHNFARKNDHYSTRTM